MQRWIGRHRALTAALVAFFGTGAVMLYQQKRAYRLKRRAKRANNGARTEVVVIVGTPESPVVKTLSQDLERRGFVVYIVVGSAQEEEKVQTNGRVDIRPLYMDITEVGTSNSNVDTILLLMVGSSHHRHRRLLTDSSKYWQIHTTQQSGRLLTN
jgi:hypothetical protein